ncbi:MAG TPA: hypothetical protein PKE27_08415 [Povalibacter sp.]|uniref:hypothetical protein n=1 Tax=Povalibacter sp. TaxID=1962978 RepID=UPI002B5142CA|nr:hypothetical protein [Povalibacter sp.]HMN44580.1 hypothetical protein [Povalibacter sp.]
MSTATTARRQQAAISPSLPNRPLTGVIPNDARTRPAANRDATQDDDGFSVNPLWMITVAFAILFGALAIGAMS